MFCCARVTFTGVCVTGDVLGVACVCVCLAAVWVRAVRRGCQAMLASGMLASCGFHAGHCGWK